MTASGLDRRALLAAGAAWLAAPAVRAAAEPAPAATSAAILAASGLGELTGFALADLGGSGLLEAHQPDLGRPPASVAKIVTTLYALEALGPDYRFATRILGAGPIEGGVLQGDLVLAGGGDPGLDTDALGALAAALRTRGLTGVSGRLLVADGALPAVAAIDPDQPAEAAYNATVSGINLNFNRVFMAWQAGATGLAFSAPGARFESKVSSIRAELVDDGLPGLRVDGGGEIWSLPRDGLRRRGSVWLPVRAPAAYAGEVFGRLAGDSGLALPAAQTVAAAPGAELARARQPAAGAGAARDAGLFDQPDGRGGRAPGRAGARAGAGRARRVGGGDDGLGAGALRADPRQPGQPFRPERRIAAVGGRPGGAAAAGGGLGAAGAAEIAADPRRAAAAARDPRRHGGVEDRHDGLRQRAGGLSERAAAPAGLRDPGRRPGRRAAIRPEEREKPPGGAAWLARARAQEQALLRRWAAVYAA